VKKPLVCRGFITGSSIPVIIVCSRDSSGFDQSFVLTWDRIQLGKKVESENDADSLTLQPARRVIEIRPTAGKPALKKAQ